MNIIEKLKSLNVEITPEIEKAFDAEFITMNEHEKKMKKVEAERDGFKERAETAEGTLQGFEGKDFDEITKDRDSWKNKYETFVREQEEAKDLAELNEAVETAIKEARGRNVKAIIAQLDMDSIKASKNRDKDIETAIKSLADSEETAFLFESDPENNRARFTKQMDGGKTGSKMTKAEIMAVSDRTERRKLIKENMDLFETANE